MRSLVEIQKCVLATWIIPELTILPQRIAGSGYEIPKEGRWNSDMFSWWVGTPRLVVALVDRLSSQCSSLRHNSDDNLVSQASFESHTSRYKRLPVSMAGATSLGGRGGGGGVVHAGDRSENSSLGIGSVGVAGNFTAIVSDGLFYERAKVECFVSFIRDSKFLFRVRFRCYVVDW